MQHCVEAPTVPLFVVIRHSVYEFLFFQQLTLFVTLDFLLLIPDFLVAKLRFPRLEQAALASFQDLSLFFEYL
jgi:hypothetical protein